MFNERGNISLGTLVVILLLIFCGWLYFKDPRFKDSINNASEVAVEHASSALESMQGLDASINPMDLETGIRKLRKGDYSRNMEIAMLLGRDGSPPARAELLPLLADEDIGFFAAVALGRMGSDALPELEEALASEDNTTRINAAEAIWRLDLEGTKQILKDALRKESARNHDVLVHLNYAVSQAKMLDVRRVEPEEEQTD